MKCFIVGLAALMVLSSEFAFATEDVEMEAGVKTWYAGYKTENTVNNISLTFDPTLLVGPAFEAEFPNHLFFEAEYLMSVEDYEKTQGPVKLSSDTKYLELAVGYSFIPEVGIFAGYKNESSHTNLGANVSESMGMSGPMIGIRGNYSFSNMFSVYASGAYVKLKSETQEPSGTVNEDATGTDYQLGMTAKFSKAFSGSLGYRIESSEGETSKVKETYSGVTIDVMYAF